MSSWWVFGMLPVITGFCWPRVMNAEGRFGETSASLTVKLSWISCEPGSEWPPDARSLCPAILSSSSPWRLEELMRSRTSTHPAGRLGGMISACLSSSAQAAWLRAAPRWSSEPARSPSRSGRLGTSWRYARSPHLPRTRFRVCDCGKLEVCYSHDPLGLVRLVSRPSGGVA